MASMNRGGGRAAVAMALGLATTAIALAAPTALASTTTAPLGQITRVGAAPVSESLSLVLPLTTDKAGLGRFAESVSTPGSTQYGQYESIPELTRRFGAPAGERARVMRYLRHAGATRVRIDGSGLFADATMSAGLADRLFGAELTAFRAASATRFTAPTSAVTIPAGLAGAVTDVVGLDTQPLALGQPPERATGAVHGSAAKTLGAAVLAGRHEIASGYAKRTGTPIGCRPALSQSGFTPNQYLTAYGYDGLYQRGIDGTGERVALIEINGYKASDVHTFAKCFSRPTPRITNYGVGIKKLLKPGGEATLDLEVLDSAAPGLKGIDVYETTAQQTGVLRALTSPLINRGRKPDVISISLGDCEKDTKLAVGGRAITTYEASLELAAASGISVLASSGDDGSSACLDPQGNPEFDPAVNYPASSRWVTGVGGTNFALNAANQIAPPAGQTSGQIVWNDQDGSGGGGYSILFRRPSWQNAVTTSPRRVVPDLSMLADPAPGYLIYCTAPAQCITHNSPNPWVSFGGTSAGTPLLAGGLALVDEFLRRNGRQDVGLANPLLYQVFGSSARAAVFSDVTQFNNDYFGLVSAGQHPVGCCAARAGFDAASGLGSVDLTNLATSAGAIVPKLVNIAVTLPPQPRPVRAEHLLATVACSGPCLMGAYAEIKIGTAKGVLQESSAYVLRRRGHQTIRIPLDQPTLHKLRTALADGARISAAVYGAVIDPSGNIERQTAPRKLAISG